MQALGCKRLHLAAELLSKRPKAMHLARNTNGSTSCSQLTIALSLQTPREIM